MWIAVLLGNVLRGIGEATIVPLGVSYIDDFTTPENSAFYIGILHTIAVIGPLFGFTLGSFCAKLYVDIGFLNLESVTISMKDARWVGAWWLGFIIAGGLSLLSALPFWFLPKSVPKEEVDGKGTTTETTEHLNSPEEQSKDHASGQQEPLSDIIKDFLPSMKRLLTNKTYFLYLITNIIMFNAFIILITYLPKYFEQQFGESASKTNFFIGVTNMPAISLGILCSGFIMKKFKLDIYKAVKLGLLTGILGLLATLPLFALSCPNSDIAGVTVSYEGVPVAQPSNLLSTCNSDCHCSTSQWDPVCGENGLTYISPCLAGCKQLQGFGKNTTYQDCRCIASFPSGASNFSSTLGQCPRDKKCSKMFIYYIAFQSLSFFLYSLGSVPMYMLNLRCVEPELKSLAIGIFTMAMRTLAGIPAPIYFGAIIDSVCMIWGVRTCGGRGACRMYQMDNFRYLFQGMILGFRLLGFVIFGFVIFRVKKKFKNDQKEIPAEVQLMVKMDTEGRPCGVNVEHLAEKELDASA
ncbi:SO1C1 protein, partial [Polypterus senegalus]|nr:SO1C1 protein [Polypterus senegalus]